MQFEIDQTDLKKLSRFFKQAPKEFQKASAGVINTLAFETRKLEIKEIAANMIVRNQKFLESSVQVQKARPVSLERQIAIVGSIRRERFTGWEEQETGTQPKNFRTASLTARGGNKKGMIRPGYRYRSANKFYRPEQFKGMSYRQSFYFMMRVLNTRGASTFLMTQDIQTKRGQLNKGLYLLRNHQILRLRSFKKGSQITHIQWRTNAIKKLKSSTNIQKVWADQITRTINKYK